MTENLTRSQMVNKLKKNTVRITFIRQDNGKRDTMVATLDPTLIPFEARQNETTQTKKVNKEIITVYSTDRQDWRSVRVDSVRKFEVV